LNQVQEISMISTETLEQLKKAPLKERISIIEVLLGTLKKDMSTDAASQTESEEHPKRPAFGFMKDTGEILGDIIAPALSEKEWEVLQ
jgi:hypothetical protein